MVLFLFLPLLFYPNTIFIGDFYNPFTQQVQINNYLINILCGGKFYLKNLLTFSKLI